MSYDFRPFFRRQQWQQRSRRQRRRLREKIVSSAAETAAQLAPVPHVPLEHGPEVVKSMIQGQRRNLDEHLAKLGIEVSDRVTFVEDIVASRLQTIGKIRSRNRTLV